MPGHDELFDLLSAQGMGAWAAELARQLPAFWNDPKHGGYADWCLALDSLPHIHPSRAVFDQDIVQIGSPSDCTEDQRRSITRDLRRLMPWRKGPFNWFGVEVDAEWRSDMKWRRVRRGVQARGRVILDVGCGNGYYGWRMLGDGARHVVGIDPNLCFNMQFNAAKKYLPGAPFHVLPLGLEALPAAGLAFDTVFSMGVLYHRRDPRQHLRHLFGCLAPGGELVVETLVIDESDGDVLTPAGRYAKMRNVFAIPSCSAVQKWLAQAGFGRVRVVDVAVTAGAEQRKTDWIASESLDTFLDPTDLSKTVEGHPAPKRGIFLADK